MPYHAGPITDWDVFLGIKPDPAAQDQPPELGPDPWADFQVPEGANITMEQGLGLIKLISSLRDQRHESEAAAIRYQGQTQYEKMIEQGVAPDEALRKAGPRMYFEHPAGLTAAMKAMQPAKAPTMDLPRIEIVDGQEFWQNPRTGDWHPLNPPASRSSTRPFKTTEQWDTLTRQISSAQKEYDRIQREMDQMGYAATGIAPTGLARRARIQQEELQRLFAERTAAQKAYDSGMGTTSGTTSSESPGIPPSPLRTSSERSITGSSPYAEGQILTNKRTGQKAKVVNGVPVPFGASTTAAPAPSPANFAIPPGTPTVFHPDEEAAPIPLTAPSDLYPPTDEEGQ